MRNIFDQYSQPENRLTHALACTLEHDRSLLPPFLRWLGVRAIPPLRTLRITEQQTPGSLIMPDEGQGTGLPDMCVFDDEGWAILFEAKVQAQVSADQLRRHKYTAHRHGYTDPRLVVITVDDVRIPHGVRHTRWRDLYAWFGARAGRSFWARQFVEYMQDFETRMLAEEYGIRGTITMFDGLRFDDENPYTYREGKRLIRLLGDALQERRDVRDIGVDPDGDRRPAITGRGAARVWDFLPLRAARGASSFTDYPHLTLGIGEGFADAALTVPNGVKGGFRTKLREIGEDGFAELLANINTRMRTVLRRAPGAKPFAYALQRHFASQRSVGVTDGRIRADLRTIIPGGGDGVKHQPEWAAAIYSLLINKRSNIQFGISTQFTYDIPAVRKPKAVDLFAETWVAGSPLLEFVLD